MIQEPSKTTTTTTTPAASKPSQDKGKAKMTEPEKPLKKKDRIMYDQEVALNLQAQLQAELEEEERLARQKLLAERLQAREQEELTDEEKARLFVELLEKRKKHFAALRAQEKRNKPPTKAQNKSTMSTYLKHVACYKQIQLKNKSFTEIQKLFDKATTRVNMFVDMDTELVRESSKKDEAKMAQESSSKRAVIFDEEGVAIDAIPLSTKPPSIVDYKIIKEGKISIYQIIRADGRHGYTRPEEGYEGVLWGDLKTCRRSSMEGKIVGIKRVHNDLRVTAAQSEDSTTRVNAAGTKLQLLKDYNCSRIKTAEKIKVD
ncbi:hypothetical protein Tco_0241057 [Tanacetum coccineum]